MPSLRLLQTAFVLFIGLVASVASAAEWYVGPDGSDRDDGSLDKPFASVQRAQRAAEPGDTVYLLGGKYRLKEADIARRKGVFARIIVLDKNGQEGRPIAY